MREFLKGLELQEDMIDTIMAEYGKNVTRDKEEITSLKGQIISLKQTAGEDWKSKYETLNNQYQKQNEDMLNENINKVIDSKTFINDYTKESIVNELKNAYQDEANAGKSIQEIFNNITNGKQNIFANSNQFTDMTPPNDINGVISKETFEKMSYKDRLELKHSNPELFAKYNN